MLDRFGNTIEEIGRTYYKILVDNYKDTDNPELQGWETKEQQNSRFDVLLDNCIESGDSLLDFGCGKADIYKRAISKQIDINYTGIDMVDYFIQFVKETYPDVSVHSCKLTEIEDKYDWCYASGTFNVGFTQETLLKHIDHMIKISLKGVCFNLLETKVYEDEILLTFDRHEFNKTLTSIYPDLEIQQITGYSQGDFTTIIRKQQKYS